ncbi:MAG TPA: ABC transporter ATP-binding protein, partial [Candidatus Polarisedimenticolaceae bacterium]|nr:ABC transporter ATP-binding protein [Candidatus Polarisedimenticolaceae bacterium]
MSMYSDTISIYWKYSWKYPRLLIGTLALLPTAVLAEWFVIPYIGASILDTLAKHPDAAFSLFIPILLLAVVIEIYGIIIWRITIRLIWKHQIKVAEDLAVNAFEHLTRQSERFHADHFGGSLVSAVNKFVGSYYRLSDIFIFNFYTLVLTYIFTAVILLPRAPLFVLVLFLVSVAFVIATYFVRRRELRFTRTLSASETRQTAQLADTITNISTMRSFGHESLEYRLFHGRAKQSSQDHLEVMEANNISEYITAGFVRGLSVVGLIVSIIVVIRYNAPLGTVLLIASYLGVLFGQLWALGSAVRGLNRAFGDAREMTNLMKITPEIQDPPHPEPVKVTKGAITFEDVSFRYAGSHRQNLFDHLSFSISPGERIGLVGPSGGGKTTVTKLLLRFADLQNGRILIDGQDIAAVAQTELRQHIAYVPQEPLLFHRSLADNIRYGRLDATDKEVKQAAELARATEFIDKLPKGYGTLVGERGTKLSGGQRQRIAIARAILKNAPLLVLDEATSALDSHSEKLIQEALHNLMEGRTTIVIAHRLSTIAELDRIIVMEEGQVVEQGTHRELQSRHG